MLSTLLTSHSAEHQAGAIQRTMRCQDEVADKETEELQADFSVKRGPPSHFVWLSMCLTHAAE